MVGVKLFRYLGLTGYVKKNTVRVYTVIQAVDLSYEHVFSLKH